MSADTPTTADLDAVIREHLAAAHGGLVTGWVLVAAVSVEGDAETEYVTEAPPWQPYHHTAGLLSVGIEGGDA